MKKETWQRFIALALCCIFLSLPIMAAEPTVTIEPYTKDEFPDWLQDLRRAEIISLGSLPFVTLGVTLGYSLYRYFSHDMNPDYFPNPFAKSSSAARLSTDEQLGILFTSLGISAAVGVVDFTISSIQRHIKNKEEEKINQGAIEIIPLEEGALEKVDEPLQEGTIEKIDEPLQEGALDSSEESINESSTEENLENLETPSEEPTVASIKEFPPFGLLVSLPERMWSVP